jgi:23S rRNA (cytosine1962-C5)-methyltransferase
METITIKRLHDKRIREVHLWVFSNELAPLPEGVVNGGLVRVRTARGDDLGTGLLNTNSLISVRLLNTSVEELDEDFFAERIAKANSMRQRILPHETSYRVVFGESDFLPGVVLDRYGDYFSLQLLSAGMDIRKEAIIAGIRSVFPDCKGIVEKNKSYLRVQEGLEEHEGICFGEIPDTVIMKELALSYEISLVEGQKTGWYLDQKVNRKTVRSLVSDMTVLDCFTNQGGFALNAAFGGASKVVGIDSSAKAIERCNNNAKLNNLENVTFEKADVFEYLDKQLHETQEWDCIILDPPSFTKSKKNVPEAKRGYARINRVALCLIRSGGLLITASCSHHIFEDVFINIIRKQAHLEGRQLQLLHQSSQSPDHPILLSMPQTRYLKFFVFRVI